MSDVNDHKLIEESVDPFEMKWQENFMSSQSSSTSEECVVQNDKLDVSENAKSEASSQSDHDVSEKLECDETYLKEQGPSMFDLDEKESATLSSETIDSDSDVEMTGIYQCSQTRKREEVKWEKSNDCW